MKVQKSFVDSKNALYLVPTPIGNMLDMTQRAIDVLNDVDLIYAEDTRVAKVLLSHFNINTPLKCYHIFNEHSATDEIISNLKSGKNVAIITDAGLPGISDPGFYVSQEAIKEECDVISLPGASASLTGLIASGLPTNHFYFYGFLDHKNSQKEKELRSLQDFKDTMIFYESPLRCKETLKIMYNVFGNRRVTICRELTKKYEEYIRSTLEELNSEERDYKGEIIIIVEGKEKDDNLLSLSVKDHYEYYINLGYSQKDAMKEVAKDRGVSKSDIYKEVIE